LALHEFKTAFTVNDSDAKLDCRQSLVNNSLPSSLAGIKPKPIIELAVAREVTRQLARKPLTKAILTKVKVKAHPQTQFTSVWTSRGVGAHTNCGVWAPNVSLGLHKANRHRLYLGHYAHKGLKDPARDIKHQRMTLEVTDLNVLRLKTSDSLASVIAELFPSPLHWRQVWNTIGKRIGGHFYAWAAVPPSPEFVALGMVGTTDDEPPPTHGFHCVPRKWCKPITAPPKLIWDDAGTGGRQGAMWQVGSFGLLQISHGHSPPPQDHLLELASHRFMLGEGSSNIWLPPALIDEAPAEPGTIHPGFQEGEYVQTQFEGDPPQH
jgi:hypothetical protein